MLGDLGHISIIIAFVSSLAFGISYLFSGHKDLEESYSWKTLARCFYGLHLGAILMAMTALFYIIFDHQYQYQYAWKHSSNQLPVHYIISCFWEGQEGSFLIWIFWNAVVGLFFFKSKKRYSFDPMVVVAVVQFCLLSMILGVYFSSVFKIGSSPFILLKDVLDDPVYTIDPQFIPDDGTGLNPLLQNIWMVIHPPIIFLGFAVALVPFAYTISGIFRGDLKSWLSKAQIWLAISIGVLGMGIMMGAYWAYETLNFGGYWNWDPVENAILIPWLVMIGGLHGLLIYQKTQKGLLFTVALILSSYGLIVYSTFLTRSGILGDSSVHSFTDLGLSGQLLFFLILVIIVIVYGLFSAHRKAEKSDRTSTPYSFEFWVVLGVGVLCLSAFQILIPTSIPVFRAILENMGVESNMAPPADPVRFYNKFQIWFAIAFGPCMAMAQLMYHYRIDRFKKLEDELMMPMIVTLILSSVTILTIGVTNWKFIILILSSLFGIVVCFSLIFKAYSRDKRTLGGALSHSGFAIMILGFVISAGYSKMISRNFTINAPDSTLPVHSIQENILLNRNQSKELGQYNFTYLGLEYLTDKGVKVLKDDLLATNYPGVFVSSSDVFEGHMKVISKYDTVQVDLVNSYYLIQVRDGSNTYYIRPRMQNNPGMGFVASPDILTFLSKDVYVHVSNFPDQEKIIWSEESIVDLIPGESYEYQGVSIKLKGTSIVEDVAGFDMSPNDLAIAASFEIQDEETIYESHPVFLISKGRVKLFPDVNQPLGLQMLIKNIDPRSGKITTSIRSSQRDWITIKAKEMPLINLVWVGTMIMIFGIGFSIRQKLGKAEEDPSIMKVSYKAIKNKFRYKPQESIVSGNAR